ncbi:hypothetical protein GNIT_3114 [Glaciecola nitratireducens FR1064]|uniref:Uncharacterized protein n=1 Tax=Glaciecola nitratireducens (strain JCM 12485 / KCTC 12276 / FR1064) TaxID=1085623 RepID=G4QIQ4_GLANF|nr:hypothetical protein GNIT_3114 [Glaciecola nitratireducens FR1064]
MEVAQVEKSKTSASMCPSLVKEAKRLTTLSPAFQLTLAWVYK